MRIGDGTTAWKDLQPLGGASKIEVYEVIVNEGETHQDAINRIVASAPLEKGSIAIVKELIASDADMRFGVATTISQVNSRFLDLEQIPDTILSFSYLQKGMRDTEFPLLSHSALFPARKALSLRLVAAAQALFPDFTYGKTRAIFICSNMDI